MGRRMGGSSSSPHALITAVSHLCHTVPTLCGGVLMSDGEQLDVKWTSVDDEGWHYASDFWLTTDTHPPHSLFIFTFTCF